MDDIVLHAVLICPGCGDFITDCTSCTVTGGDAFCKACSGSKYPDGLNENCVGKNTLPTSYDKV